MNVCISVAGRFHAFNLAHQLHRRDALGRLITSYPRYVANRFGVPRDKTRSLIWKEIAERAHRRLPAALQIGGTNPWLRERFDRAAAKRVPDCDVCTAWSGSGLHTLRCAKSKGAMTVIERGSSHIEYQRDILEEEYARYGIDAQPVPQRTIAKELEEYEETDYIAIPSHFVKRSFREKGVPEERLIHVPYGVDLDEFHPLPQKNDIFRVINVGTQSIRKGTRYLLQAFSELDLPNAELLLVGAIEGSVKPIMEKYADSFRYVSPVDQSELIHYYSSASVFVICLLEEGLSMVQAQAMACGLPVICTTHTGGEDLLRDGEEGFILSIRDVEKLKEKILFFYENRDAVREMGEAALQRVQSGFTWDDYGDNMYEAYEQRLREHMRA